MSNITTGGGAGQTYSHAQLETLWQSAGGSHSAADTAAAIAQAESAGNSAVTSPNPDGGTNVGLWQLDTRGKGAGHTIAQLQNPATNARLAVAGSSDGSDWSAWATYASGAYKAYLTGAATGVQPNPPPVTTQPTGLAAIGSFFSTLGQANLWIRVGEVALGIVLLAVGIARITSAVPAATSIAKTAGAVAVL